MSKLIYTSQNYNIVKHQGIPNEAIDFLDRIAWGSEGAVYENKNMKTHINELYNPSLYAIHDNDNIQGTAAFCNTFVKANQKEYNCNYIKYFASSKEIRGRGIMKDITTNVMRLVREGEESKTIYFACVERGNHASYNVVKSSGYEQLCVVKTMGFSRFFPKDSDSIERITDPKDKTEILSILDKTYHNYSLVHFNPIFKEDNYFVIKKAGKVVAGCQMHRGHWKVNKMKGISGKIMLSLLPNTPFLRRIFNPNKFEFLAFEGIFFEDGHEEALKELFEGLLFREKLNSALFWMDEKCPIRHKIASDKKLGILHAFVKKSDVYVMASYANLSAEDTNEIKSCVQYVSAFDYV